MNPSISLFALLIASSITGLLYVLNKTLTIKSKSQSSEVITASTAYVRALIAIPLLFIQPFFSTNPLTWALIGLSTLAFGLSSYFSFQAYKRIEVSVISVIHRFNIIFTAIAGILIFSETYSLLGIIGLILIFTASIAVIYEGKRFHISTGVIFAFLMAVTSSITALMDKQY